MIIKKGDIVENLSINEQLEKYPYLKAATKNYLFIENSELEELKESDVIEVDDVDVKIDFLKKVLEDDRYYSYVKKYFNGEIEDFHVASIYMGDTIGNIEYSKLSIIKGIEYLLQNKILFLNSEEEKKFNELKNSISFDKFLQKINEEIYDVLIDGIKYHIKVKDMLSLMLMHNKEFDKLCYDNTVKTINGIAKNHFVYAVYRYFRNSGVLNEYIMPEIIIKRYDDIRTFKKIDIEAINRFLKTKDTKHKEFEINKELKKFILDGMPENASKLEKAIYIYIKMCKTLTYDDEYYAVNQKGKAVEKHLDINYASKITPSNNKVVCFEFNIIYSKFLSELGINFESEYKNLVGEAYGYGHASLTFRDDKFLVKADSVTSVLNGDLIEAKLNRPLNGLKCMNCNFSTNIEFNEMVMRMYKLVVEQEAAKNKKVNSMNSFEEIMNDYEHATDSIKPVSLNEKLSILINKVNSAKFVGIDSLAIILKLKKILFNEDERVKNVRITIIRNNEPFERENVAMASMIITLNSVSIVRNPGENTYYYFNPDKDLVSITKEELQDKFDNGIFEYVSKDDPLIPGIESKVGAKK